jgi:hypothetical protein
VVTTALAARAGRIRSAVRQLQLTLIAVAANVTRLAMVIQGE